MQEGDSRSSDDIVEADKVEKSAKKGRSHIVDKKVKFSNRIEYDTGDWAELRGDHYERDEDGNMMDDPYLEAERGENGLNENVGNEEHEPEEEREGGEEERRKSGAKIRKAPKNPSRAEREEHEALHSEHKDWCRHCVRGRGRTRRHERIERDPEEEERRVPRISMDYHFAGERDDPEIGTWLTLVDSKSKAIWTRIVSGKGKNLSLIHI